MLERFKALWRAWKGLAHRLVDAQNRLLMALVYLVAVLPVAVVVRALRVDLLARPEPEPGSHWIRRREPMPDMDRARRMY